MGIMANIWTVESSVSGHLFGGIYGLATLQLAHKRITGEMPKLQNGFAVPPFFCGYSPIIATTATARGSSQSHLMSIVACNKRVE